MIPVEFIERLERIFPPDNFKSLLDTFTAPEVVSIRLNPLKCDPDSVLDQLTREGVIFSRIPSIPDAYVLDNMPRSILSRHSLVGEGKIYQQSLASMIPVVVLDPKPGEHVFDACAAPGSKTTQIAAMMHNTGMIVAVESVKARFFRLKAVCQLLGAEHVVCKLCDMRRFRPVEGVLFDRILVDAPCSSEGRFKADEPKTFGYWSLRKIKEMSYKQKGILLSASRQLKPGGVMVYATCTFAPEENEEVVDWFLKKSQGAFILEDAGIDGVPRDPAISSWGKDVFAPVLEKCLRVKPNRIFGGFFVAKFRRI